MLLPRSPLSSPMFIFCIHLLWLLTSASSQVPLWHPGSSWRTRPGPTQPSTSLSMLPAPGPELITTQLVILPDQSFSDPKAAGLQLSTSVRQLSLLILAYTPGLLTQKHTLSTVHNRPSLKTSS